MNLQKINFKIYFKNPAAALPETFFKVFNDWIPDSPEIFIDVADYSHVHDGPMTILVGHHVDAILDDSGRKRGFVYSQKTEMTGTNPEKIQNCFSAFAKACQRLKQNPDLQALEFDGSEILFFVNDRGLAPNNANTYEALKTDLTTVFDKIYGAGQYSLAPSQNPKERFSVIIKSSRSVSLGDFLK